MLASDKELLAAFAAKPCGERLEPIVERYSAFVHSAACRQSGNQPDAAEVTRAVFLAFMRRARSLSRRTVLAGWFFRATRLASAKQARVRKGKGPPAVPDASAPGLPRTDERWARIAPLLDRALDSIRLKRRDALLLSLLMNRSAQDAAPALRTRESRVRKRAAKGFSTLVRRLRKRKLFIDPELLRTIISENGSSVDAPADLKEELLAAAGACRRRRPKSALVTSTLCALTWSKWKRRLIFAGSTVGVLAVLIASLAGGVVLLWNTGRLLPLLIEFGARQQIKKHPELALPARPWPADAKVMPSAASIQTAQEFYVSTNVWLAHLRFTSEHWAELAPKRVPPVPQIMQPDGTVVLRNPHAQRNGIAGSLGFDFNWTHADFELGGLLFTNAAARLRGNGTYLGSLYGSKHPYKVDLNKFEKQQHLAGIRTFNFLNCIEDRSYMSDLLGYELFRAAGVPASATAYAWLTISAEGQFAHKPLGLYLLVQNVDATFAEEWFGSRSTPIFKPVTTELFKYLGEDWAAYEAIYDLKTKAAASQKQRVIDFARLLTDADDEQFERRVGDFLDLDEVGRYLAGLVLVANYDSLLTYGQNFYLYLDPRTDQFGFIPWDMDQAWGMFPQFGTTATRERASIWHPWVGKNRFLERLMAVEEFRRVYRLHLEQLLETAFVPERLYRRIDEVAPAIRDAIASESSFRARLFDQAISTNWLAGPQDGGDRVDPPVHQIKRFMANRARSVRAQLDGRSRGLVLERSSQF